MAFRTVERSGNTCSLEGLEFITFKSNCLKGRADVTTYVPRIQIPNDQFLPVIVLLHGVYGSHWSWALNGNAHKTLQSLIDNGSLSPFLLVMPSDGLWGDGSGYVPHRTKNFEELIGIEIPQLMQQEYPFVGPDSQFYIAGLSMGGYGAFRVGLTYDIYKGVSGHSSILDLRQMKHFVEEDWTEKNDTVKHRSIKNLILNHNGDIKPLRFDCGIQDELCLPHNNELHQSLVKFGIEHIYDTSEGGHDWEYWKSNLIKTYVFFDELFKGDTAKKYE